MHSPRRRPALDANHWLTLLNVLECQGMTSLGIDCYRISLRIARVLGAACESARRRRSLAQTARDDAPTDEDADAVWGFYVGYQRTTFKHIAHEVGWLIGLRIGLILAVKSEAFASGAQELYFARRMAEFFRAQVDPPADTKQVIARLEAARYAWVHAKHPTETVRELSGGFAYRAIAMARAKGSQAREFIAAQTELREFARAAQRVL